MKDKRDEQAYVENNARTYVEVQSGGVFLPYRVLKPCNGLLNNRRAGRYREIRYEQSIFNR